jgi:hypothetical protein
MLKTISAALLAASVLAAPALAASNGKTDTAPVSRSTTDKTAPDKTSAVTPTKAKPGVLNANASMHDPRKHHVKHARHYRNHNRMAAKTHAKISLKRSTVSKTAIKHG